MSMNERTSTAAPRLTVSILTRNGASRLPRLLAEVATFADEIVIGVDSSSIDQTEAVALGTADVVFRFDHRNELSEARMRIFDYASGDWIFVIDDDESLESDFPKILRELMAVPLITHAWFPRRWIVQEDPPVYLSGSRWYPDWQMRLFKNNRDIVWKPSKPHTGYHVLGPGFQEYRAAILHYEPVWGTAEERAAKLERYRAGGAAEFTEGQYFVPLDVLRLPCPEPRIAPETFARRDVPGKLEITKRPQDARPDDLWAMEILSVECPVAVRCDETVIATVRVRNIGQMSWWPSWGIRSADLAFSHHITMSSGECVAWDGERTKVNSIVRPGDETIFLHTFRVPNSSGEFIIDWDMVNENVCWFEKPKSHPLSTWALSVGQSVEEFASPVDRCFLSDRVHAIPGWLGDYAALRSMELMRWQTTKGLSGPALEIGVYAGRYFSVLQRECAFAGEAAVGVDIFHRVSEEEVRANLAGATNISFLHGSSKNFDAARLLHELSAQPRFISIDGSHLLDDVKHDLDLSDEILADHGIIACDDFLNPVRLGVAQAVHEKLVKDDTLVPFAVIQSKILLCRPAYHESIRELMALSCRRDAQGPTGECFARNEREDPSRNKSVLYGWDVVVAP